MSKSRTRLARQVQAILSVDPRLTASPSLPWKYTHALAVLRIADGTLEPSKVGPEGTFVTREYAEHVVRQAREEIAERKKK